MIFLSFIIQFFSNSSREKKKERERERERNMVVLF